MPPDDSNFTDIPPIPQTEDIAYQTFLSAFNHGTLKIHFDSDRPPKIASERILFYLKAGTPPTVTGHLGSKRLAKKVVAAARLAWGAATPGEVAYVVGPADRGAGAGERDPPYYAPVAEAGLDLNMNTRAFIMAGRRPSLSPISWNIIRPRDTSGASGGRCWGLCCRN